MLRQWNRHVANERGATAVLVVVCIAMLMAAGAIAVDLGMMFDSRGEAQRVADAAALAGAAAYMTPLSQPDADATAVLWAEEYGGRNRVRGRTVTPEHMQIRPDFVEGRVEVIVTRDEIPTWFARIFGTPSLRVSGRAVAQVMESGTVECLKPFIMPDAYHERGGDPRFFNHGTADYYAPGVTSYGTAYRNQGGPDYKSDGIENDVGRQIIVKMGHPGQAPQPGWFFPISLDGRGGNNYRNNIANRCPLERLSVDAPVTTEQGNMIGPTLQGFIDLVGQDPGARWSDGRIVGSAFGNGTGLGSPRVVVMPLFDPRDVIQNGRTTVRIQSFGSFFIEGVDPCPQGSCNPDAQNTNRNVYARWMGVTGAVADNCRATGTCRPNVQYLRLVE